MSTLHPDNAEAALVSRLLVDPQQLAVIAGSLRPEDFYSSTWRKAYAGMQQLSTAQQSVDIVALQGIIGEDANELARRVGDLGAAHRAPLEDYVQMIQTAAFRRRLIATLEQLTMRAQTVGSRETLLAELQDAVMQTAAGVEQGNLLSSSKAIDHYIETLAERGQGQRNGLSWGLKALDDMLSPAQGGEMIVVAARPSVGKTVLAEQIADHWAHTAPYPVLFASLEMSVDSLLDRTVARVSGVPGHEVIRGILDHKGKASVDSALAARRDVGLWYLDDPYAQTSSIRAAAAKVRIMAGGLSGIVIDYLQLLKDPGDAEVQRVTKMSRQAKAIAREFGVPMLALSQLNRAVTAREDQHPKLHDLRESGALEQDADRVLGLYRETLQSREADVEVLKARQGVTGRIPLSYDGEHFRFGEPDMFLREELTSAEESNEGLLDLIGSTTP